MVRRGREIALEILDRREDLQSPGARDVRRNSEELLRQSLAATRTAVVDLVEPQGALPAELEEHERLHVFRALKLALGHEPIDGPLELRRNRRGSRAVAPKTLSEDVHLGSFPLASAATIRSWADEILLRWRSLPSCVSIWRAFVLQS